MKVDINVIQDDIHGCHSRVKELQHQTIECIAIRPGKTDNGKPEIVVIERDRLQTIDSEVSRLSELADHNTEVLTKLTAALQDYPTVDSIRKKKAGLEEQIARTKNLLRIDTGDLIKHGHDVDPADPYSHPKGKALKAEADAALGIINSALAAVTDLLEQAEGTVQEFRASGLEPQRAEPRGIISREKVSGLVG